MKKSVLSAILLAMLTCNFHAMFMNNFPTYLDNHTDNNSNVNHTTLNSLVFLSSLCLAAMPYMYNKLFNVTHNKPELKAVNELWIKTSDKQTFLLDIEKDLPQSGLSILLKKYAQCFGYLNSEENSLPTAYSYSDYQLLHRAHCILKKDMPGWKFTESEQETLLKIATASKIYTLYLALIDPIIQTNALTIPGEISSNVLLPLLSLLTKELLTPDGKIATSATKYTRQSQNNTTCDQRYYIKYDGLYDAKHKKCLLDIPHDAQWSLLPHKNLILISSIKSNLLFIYDIKNKRKYYLPTTCLGGCDHPCISPDENYIATFSETDCHKKYDKNLIYVWNISDLDTIKYYKPLYHKNVSQILFSPDSTSLISGADNNSIECWKLDELSDDEVIAQPLLKNDTTIDTMLFNNEGTTLAIQHSHDVFNHFITLINTTTSQNHTLFARKRYPCYIFPNKSDYIMYSTCDEQYNGFIFKIITSENKELYTKQLPLEHLHTLEHLHKYSCVLSNDNRHIALNFSHEQQLDLLTIDTIDNSLQVKKSTFKGECDYLNNDGSFYTHTPHTIDLYNPKTNGYTTVCHVPNKLIVNVDIVPKKNLITYSYHTDNKEKRRRHIPLLKAELHNTIQKAASSLTPLQYMLINKVYDAPRSKEDKYHYSIPQDSIDHLALKSFGAHEKMLGKALRLQITDK